MTRTLLEDLAILFETEAASVAAGQRGRVFLVEHRSGRRETFLSTFDGAEQPDHDEANRLDQISDELRGRAQGRAA